MYTGNEKNQIIVCCLTSVCSMRSKAAVDISDTQSSVAVSQQNIGIIAAAAAAAADDDDDDDDDEEDDDDDKEEETVDGADILATATAREAQMRRPSAEEPIFIACKMKFR